VVFFYEKGSKNQLIFKWTLLSCFCGVCISSFLSVFFVIMDLNKVMLIGRATNNLQLKMIESSNTPVVNFTVATNRKFKNKEGNIMEDAEYHRCVSYGKGAEVLGKYLTKGKRIYLEGRLRTRKWQDNTGQDRFSTEIIVDNFIFLDSRNRNEGENAGSTEDQKGSLKEDKKEEIIEGVKGKVIIDVNPEDDEEVPF